MRIYWDIVKHPPIHWRRFNDEEVVFSELTGDTHLLSPLAVAILRDLNNASKTSADLLSSLSQQASDDLVQLEKAIGSGLISLYDMGLVTKVER